MSCFVDDSRDENHSESFPAFCYLRWLGKDDKKCLGRVSIEHVGWFPTNILDKDTFTKPLSFHGRLLERIVAVMYSPCACVKLGRLFGWNCRGSTRRIARKIYNLVIAKLVVCLLVAIYTATVFNSAKVLCKQDHLYVVALVHAYVERA